MFYTFLSKKLHKNVAALKYITIHLRDAQSTTLNIIPLIQFKPKFKIFGICNYYKRKTSYKQWGWGWGGGGVSYVRASWNRYKLFVAATAIMFSCGCQAVWSILWLKSKHSTVISSFFLFPVTATRRGLRICLGLLNSGDASKQISCLSLRSKMWKKLL